MRVKKEGIFEYVIIGSGPAGISAVEGIRIRDKRNRILLITQEDAAYSRPLITYYFAGKLKRNALYFRDRKFFSKNNVDILKGEVVKVLPEKRKVILKTGRAIRFKKLLLATGGLPFSPRIKGDKLDGVITFNSLKDVDDLRKRKFLSKRAVVLGAGMIGLKAAEAFKLRGWTVHLAELADKVLPLVLDKTGSAILVRVLEERGIKVYLKDTIVQITGHGRAEKVRLKSGADLIIDLVVIAVGVKPNFPFLHNAGKKGIKTSRFMETEFEGIYAAGDVVESEDIICNETKNIGVWPLAYRQGRVAGINMASGRAEYGGGWLMNSISIFDYPVITFGKSRDEQGEILKKLDRKTGVYHKIFLEQGRIRGAILMGSIERAGIYNGLMEEGIDVSPFKKELLVEEFSLISVPHKHRYREITPVEI